MSIAKLMGNDRAIEIYCTIPSGRAPLNIASDYMLAKLADDKAAMLALEEHARDLARVHFHRDDVRQALALVEHYKGARRPGRGGIKMLQGIADTIERDYAAGDYIRLADGRAQFWVANLKLTCLDLPGAVAWMAAKYRRGVLPFNREAAQ
jgi:hypothetical protein